MTIAQDTTRIGIKRHFTKEGVHPYEMFKWEKRTARIDNMKDGSTVFLQENVEVPDFWSVNATNILAQKYFRGTLNTQEREYSLKQVVDRIVDTITKWGEEGGYFSDEREREAFRDELKFIMISQRAVFNSPVWFNIGVAGVPQQASACFILAVEDTMNSILNWYREEGLIFKGGSGAGVNLSRIRSSKEGLSGGGQASGPVSFMRGADASAGTIKSGGKTRRAAKMVVLNADHPDIRDFIWCKAIEERKARALRDAGFDVDLDGKDSYSLQYQNANNSVRVTDEFMNAVLQDKDWELIGVSTKEPIEKVKARDLFREIAQAAWECADPGVQFDTTINMWHTAPNTGPITASNPCFTGDSLVHTDRGLIRFDKLIKMASAGEQINVYTHNATAEIPSESLSLTSPDAFMITGVNEIIRVEFENGLVLKLTPNHSVFTVDRGYVKAKDLTKEDRVKVLNLPTQPIKVTRKVNNAGALKGETFHLTEDLAHLIGWQCVRDVSDVNILTYNTKEEISYIMPLHKAVLSQLGFDEFLKERFIEPAKVQLVINHPGFETLLSSLGINEDIYNQIVPEIMLESPSEIALAYLGAIFDRALELSSEKIRARLKSLELLRGIQILMLSLGIRSKVQASKMVLEVLDCLHFASKVNLRAIRGSKDVLEELAFDSGSSCVEDFTRVSSVVDEGLRVTYNLSEPKNHSYIVNGVVVKNCSEYVHLDNSSCNLASINLLKFLRDDNTFDADAFKACVEVIFLAQEILVGNADYPTEKIAETSRDFRQLGLGFANLGALLMSLGLPYDSDEGRALAGAITALMTGHAYLTSAKVATRLGPFAGFYENREPMLKVLKMHREKLGTIDSSLAPQNVLQEAKNTWDETCRMAEIYGVRNSQATVIAPTGTISFVLDCDTTGIEPDLSLVKTKKLVGGGTMSIVNRSIERALKQLGYESKEVEEILAFIYENHNVIGAPYLKKEHYAVFATSFGENSISHMGHIKMMAAVQPFISGAISKTLNLPESATVEDIEEAFIESWKLGLKAVAVYRDNCKVAQPLSTSKSSSSASGQNDPELARKVEDLERKLITQHEVVVKRPMRERLPKRRRSSTFKFKVADCEGYVTVGEYEDGRPGEIFIKVSKQGSTLAGVMDAFSIAVSLGLQHGVPLSTFVNKYTNMRFEPAGITDDPELKIASSVVDYIFRRLAVDYLPFSERKELGILTTGERLEQPLPGMEEGLTMSKEGSDLEGYDQLKEPVSRDNPLCYQCGTMMQRSGSCYVCSSCGATSGCS